MGMTNPDDRDMGYRAAGQDGVFMMQGKSPEEAPYPPALAIGNIVKLDKPYSTDRNPWHKPANFKTCKCGYEYKAPSVYKDQRRHQEENGFKYGIIVEHVSRNSGGTPIVSLHLYDDEGRLFMGPNLIPEYVDFTCDEFTLYKVATELGYLPHSEKGEVDDDQG
ncbi:MAG: hypothetical protein HY675_25590 [Chloroflexi bacterium]|nr:hypothetical protein [Chloroflexota bacterium]